MLVFNLWSLIKKTTRYLLNVFKLATFCFEIVRCRLYVISQLMFGRLSSNMSATMTGRAGNLNCNFLDKGFMKFSPGADFL